ncbi:helix-turn-helix domain-containing protein [Chitinophaga oryziterrae]|uniref:Helix-turn-helix domain-containing protein n=2 Tax=Chitinophaga oryziterrae TaxID=1031224 RepID=A0A6N8J8B3_9BACT|nr:helix-turn-helix domain-containing protein [Chitinophaga oryziterrae]
MLKVLTMKQIPVFSLDMMEGLVIERFEKAEVPVKPAHRDDHYIFIFQEEGHSKVMVDFNELTIDGCAVLCILPGQVHQGISATDTVAWFIAIDSELVSPVFQPNKPAAIAEAGILKRSISLLYDIKEKMPRQVVRSLTDACLGMFAQAYGPSHQDHSRAHVITRHFKSLLVKFNSSPADYASSLNISTAYLNEAVKSTTGFSVTYWIQQEIIMEAKRILYYTDNSVKEIANTLGYEDSTYFSRLFSKVAGISPVQFRAKYRE